MAAAQVENAPIDSRTAPPDAGGSLPIVPPPATKAAGRLEPTGCKLPACGARLLDEIAGWPERAPSSHSAAGFVAGTESSSTATAAAPADRDRGGAAAEGPPSGPTPCPAPSGASGGAAAGASGLGASSLLTLAGLLQVG